MGDPTRCLARQSFAAATYTRLAHVSVSARFRACRVGVTVTRTLAACPARSERVTVLLVVPALELRLPVDQDELDGSARRLDAFAGLLGPILDGLLADLARWLP